MVFITAYMYECCGKSEDDTTTTGGRVQKVILQQQQKKINASLKVRPLVNRSILDDGGAVDIDTVRKHFKKNALHTYIHACMYTYKHLQISYIHTYTCTFRRVYTLRV